MHDLILSCDIGTTSLKMALVTLGGEVVSHYTVYFETPGHSFVALQWENAFYEAALFLLESLSSSKNTSSVNGEQNFDSVSQREEFFIRAVSISGNGPTVVTENGRTFSWNETNLFEALEKVGENCRKSLFAPKILSFFSKYKADLDCSPWLLSGPEWLVYKLTGSAVTLLPEERYKTAYWTTETTEELKAVGFPVEKLPPYVKSCSKMGQLLQDTVQRLGDKALQFGISDKTPVFGAGPDFIAAMIGTNALKPGVLYDCAGSSEGINFCIKEAVFKDGLRTLPSVMTGLWNVAALSVESGRKFMEKLLEDQILEDRNLLTEGGAAYKKFFDDSLNDKSSEGYKLISEILSQVKDGIEKLRTFALENNISFPDYLVLCGGQAKNEKWMQSRSNFLGMEIRVCNHPDAELVGNAICAFTGLGVFKSMAEAAESLVKVTKIYKPGN